MANLIKRENRDVARSASPEHRLDPFRMMDAPLRWDPFRGHWGGVSQLLRDGAQPGQLRAELHHAGRRGRGQRERRPQAGVQTLRIPKKPEAQPKRIAIGKGGEAKAKA